MKTDEDGLSKAFAAHGRYGVAARRAEDKGGEFGGKKDAAVRHIATLMCDVAARPTRPSSRDMEWAMGSCRPSAQRPPFSFALALIAVLAAALLVR